MVDQQIDVPVKKWRNAGSSQKNEGPDPIEFPHFYDGISQKRILAYVIDFLICLGFGIAGTLVAAVVGVLSLGLLFAPIMAALALIPIVYHTYFMGSERNATPGMRFMGIRVYRLDGGAPEMIQAFVQTALFFFTVPSTSFLILIVCLFNTRRRCLHDILAGTLVLNDVNRTEQ